MAHLSAASAYEGYYAVLNEQIQKKYGEVFFSPSEYSYFDTQLEYVLNEAKNNFETFLKRLIDYEKVKEKKFINKFIKKYGQLDKDLEDKLKKCLENNNFSEAFTYIHIVQHNLQNEFNQIDYNLESWLNYVKGYLNVTIKTIMTEGVFSIPKDSFLNMTPKEIFDHVLKYTEQELLKDEKKSIVFSKFLEQFSSKLFTLVENNSKFGKKLFNKPIIKNKWRMDSKNNNKTPQERYVDVIVEGLVNGLSAEEFQVILFGGVSTARTTRKQNFFTGKSREVSNETDSFLIFNSDLEIDEEVTKNLKEITKNEEIRKLINELPEDDFVIHYSIKDISIAEEKGENPIVTKIKGKGSIDSRIPALESLGMVSNTYSEIHGLIFSIINSGLDLLYSGNIGNIENFKESLSYLVVAYMFEDMDEQVKKMISSNGAGGQELHLYMISGRYVTISNLLEKMLNSINSIKVTPVIRVGITPAKTNYWEELPKSAFKEPYQNRWEEVRNKTIQNTYMSVSLLSSNILKLLNLF